MTLDTQVTSLFVQDVTWVSSVGQQSTGARAPLRASALLCASALLHKPSQTAAGRAARAVMSGLMGTSAARVESAAAAQSAQTLHLPDSPPGRRRGGGGICGLWGLWIHAPYVHKQNVVVTYRSCLHDLEPI